MKRILLAVLLLTATSASAEWVAAGNSDASGGIEIYIDPATIRRSGNMVKMWSLIDYKTLQEKQDLQYRSQKMQFEYDCNDYRNRLLYSIMHSKQMGIGDVVYSLNIESPKWTPVPPGSISETLMGIACVKK
jgi:hypothetical protein